MLIYLVPTFKDIQKSKQTSFNRSLYSSFDKIISFHSIVCGMYKRLHSDLTEPLPFHKDIGKLAQTRPHFRHYIQNINCIERLIPNLNAKTVRLYSRVD